VKGRSQTDTMTSLYWPRSLVAVHARYLPCHLVHTFTGIRSNRRGCRLCIWWK